MIRREVLNGRPWSEIEVELIHEDPDLFVTYIPTGAAMRYPLGSHPWYPKPAWEGNGVLMLHRPGDWYAVWVFWRGEEREFAGWYINFQEPYRRWEGGYDTLDLELDIWIPRDGPWEWKDRERFEEDARNGRITTAQATEVRTAAEQVAADLDAGRWWWDTAWAEWSPAS